MIRDAHIAPLRWFVREEKVAATHLTLGRDHLLSGAFFRGFLAVVGCVIKD